MGVVRREWYVDSKGSRSESFYFIDKQRYFLTKTKKKMNETIFLRATFSRWRKEKKCRMSCSFFCKFLFVIYLTRCQQPRYSREYGLEMMRYIQPSPQQFIKKWSRPIVTLRLALDFDDDCIDSVLLQKMARIGTLPVISTLYRELPQGDVSRPDIYHPYWGETRKELAREISASHPTQPNPKPSQTLGFSTPMADRGRNLTVSPVPLLVPFSLWYDHQLLVVFSSGQRTCYIAVIYFLRSIRGKPAQRPMRLMMASFTNFFPAEPIFVHTIRAKKK
jgi:hypothetical protein